MNETANRKMIRIYALIAIVSLAAGLLITFNSAPLSGITGYLNGKTNDVLGLTALATTAAATISLIPGDAATPVANILTNFSGLLLIVLTGILFEKYLLTITAFLAFVLLIPLACVFMILCEYRVGIRSQLRRIASKMALFGLSMFLVVPVSVGLSMSIDVMADNPVAHTLETGTEAVDQVEEAADGSENKNFFEQAADAVVNGFQQLGRGVQDAVDQVKVWINQFMESVAVLLITSIVIPILTYFVLYFLLKQFFAINTYQLRNTAGRTKQMLTRQSFLIRDKKNAKQISIREQTDEFDS